MKIKHAVSVAIVGLVLFTVVPMPVAAQTNTVQEEMSIWQDCVMDYTPEYFEDSFSTLQGIKLDEFEAGFDAALYDFFAGYITKACIAICNPLINEPQDDDIWIFHEFILDGITLEDAKTLFENHYGEIMFEEEGCYGYENDGNGFGLNYEDDHEGNQQLRYSIAMKSQALPNAKTIEDYHQITAIPLPLSEHAYLQSMGLDYDAGTKEVAVIYEYTLFSGRANTVFREYSDTVSKIEGGVDGNGILSSVIRPGVYLAAWVDKNRYDDVDAIHIEVEPLPVSVFSCGFEEYLNAVWAGQPVPVRVAKLLEIAIPSFAEYDLVLDCAQDSVCIALHSDSYNSRQFDQAVWNALGLEGESDVAEDGFRYVTDDTRVSFYYNPNEGYARFEIQCSAESMLDYGNAIMEGYPYAFMPSFPDAINIIDRSYPITVDYDMEHKAFSYRKSDEFMMWIEVDEAQEVRMMDYLMLAYPPRDSETSEITIKGVPATIRTEPNKDGIVTVEIAFCNSHILRRDGDDIE